MVGSARRRPEERFTDRREPRCRRGCATRPQPVRAADSRAMVRAAGDTRGVSRPNRTMCCADPALRPGSCGGSAQCESQPRRDACEKDRPGARLAWIAFLAGMVGCRESDDPAAKPDHHHLHGRAAAPDPGVECRNSTALTSSPSGCPGRSRARGCGISNCLSTVSKVRRTGLMDRACTRYRDRQTTCYPAGDKAGSACRSFSRDV